MEVFRFLKFKVYQESKAFNRDIYLLARGWRMKDKSLADQLVRASISVCLNIAEGSAKGTDKDFRRYVQNALGSINEVVSCLDIALSLELLSKEEYLTLVDKSLIIAKQLGGLSKRLLS